MRVRTPGRKASFPGGPGPAPVAAAGRLDLRFAGAVAAGFLALAAPVVARHEMWGDELQAWLLARDSRSLPELFHHLEYEGHPGLWHLLLYGLQRAVSRAPEAMQWLHLAIAAATVGIVAAAAPFPRAQRLLFAFGYYAFYEYAAVSRNYALGFLLTALACALVASRVRRPLALGVVLLLLAHTNVFGTIGAAALVAGLAVERRLARGRAPDRGVAVTLGLGALGVLTAAWRMHPPPDYGFAVGWHFAPDLDRLRLALRIPAFALVPLHPMAHDFWGRTVVGEHVWVRRLALALSAALLVWTARVAAARPAALVWYALTVLGCLGFYYVKYLGSLRHYGALVMAVVTARWLALAAKQEPAAARASARRRGRALSAALESAAFTAFLGVQAAAGLATGWLDWRYVFSGARAAAALAGRPELSGCLLAGAGIPTDVGVAAVLAYAGRRSAYYVRTERFESFVIWDTLSLRPISGPVAAERARRLAAETRRGVLLLVPWRLSPAEDSRLLAAYTGSAVPEDFFIYAVSPPEPAPGPAAARCRLPRGPAAGTAGG